MITRINKLDLFDQRKTTATFMLMIEERNLRHGVFSLIREDIDYPHA